MNPQESATNEFPLLHVYPPSGPRQPLHIIGNTAGLRSLLEALISALGQEASGICELICADAEPFEVQVERVEIDEECLDLPLPYPEEPSVQAEPEELGTSEPVADLYSHYTGGLA